MVAEGGAAVRERPWGRVLARRGRGRLLRADLVCDGWARLQEDFVEGAEGVKAETNLDGKGDGGGWSPSDLGSAANAEDAEAGSLLEGWVLLDGRGLGLPRQLARRAEGEAEPPPPVPPPSAQARAARCAARRAAEAARGEDWSVGTLLRETRGGEELALLLSAAGVEDLHALIAAVSEGDAHEALKAMGVVKLGGRQKLAALVTPYWRAQRLKEAANALYRSSRFEEAAAQYSAALELVGCRSAELSLTLLSNRAACLQQMREPKAALADTLLVLEADPTNAKALARKQVCEQAVMAEV